MRRSQPMYLAFLLATVLFPLACESPPGPAARQRLSFLVDGTTDRITGGGKLGDGRDFATFGFNARSGQGQIQWVQHCLDGVMTPGTCAFGSFTFHGSTVTAYGAALDDLDHCRVWSGIGEARFKNPATTETFPFVAKACDFENPGRGVDEICFTFDAYLREGTLMGGNIQLHKGTVEPAELTCSSDQDV